MRPTRLALLLAAVLVVGAARAPALADSGSDTTTLQLQRVVGPPTSQVTVTGTGFGAAETVLVDFAAAQVAVASTDAGGGFSTSFTVPATARPGKHVVTATGQTSMRTAAAAFLVRTNWPGFHFDQGHTGSNPYENVLNTRNVSRLEQAWTYDTGFYIESSPAIVKGVLYVGSDDERLYALNAKTGAVNWTFKTGYWVKSAPAVVDGVVYVGSSDGYLYALDAADGAVKWAYNASYAVVDAPTVADGMIYVGSNDGTLHAIHAATGVQAWSLSIGNNGFFSSPVVVHGVVYVGSWTTGKLFALDATTGAVRWSYTTGYSLAGPTVVNGVVYVPLDGADIGTGGVDAINAATGALKWFRATGNYVYTTPAVADGLVYVGSGDHKIYALKAANGAVKWTYTTGLDVTASAAVANGVVYDGSNDGNVYALDAATGVLDWSYATGAPVISSPAVANGKLYIGSDTGIIYAFGLS